MSRQFTTTKDRLEDRKNGLMLDIMTSTPIPDQNQRERIGLIDRALYLITAGLGKAEGRGLNDEVVPAIPRLELADAAIAEITHALNTCRIQRHMLNDTIIGREADPDFKFEEKFKLGFVKWLAAMREPLRSAKRNILAEVRFEARRVKQTRQTKKAVNRLLTDRSASIEAALAGEKNPSWAADTAAVFCK